MPTDRRKGARRYVAQGARVARENSSDLQDCRIVDVSAFGARLELKDVSSVPDRFMLVLSHDGQLRRRCSVVWRSSHSVGIEFKPPFPTKVKNQM